MSISTVIGGVNRCLMSAVNRRNLTIITIVTLGLLPSLWLRDGFYLHGDALNQLMYFVFETKRMYSTGMPLWSWDTFFGQDFMTSYAYYTSINPFAWLNCLFPYEYINVGFIITVYIKFLLCGYITERYLRILGFDKEWSLAGTLLYTFSAWAIVSLYYYLFIDAMLLFPLVLIGVERLLSHQRHCYTSLTLIIFVTIWINYYLAPGTIIAATIYYFARLASKRYDIRIKFMLTLRALLSVSLGILLSSVVLLPVYLLLEDSARATVNLYIGLFAHIERFVSLFLPKIIEGGTPFIYLSSAFNINTAFVAIFGVLTPTLYFFKRKDWVGWLFVIYLICYLTPINGLFSLFTSSVYTRWAYALILICIVATLYYFRDYGLPPKKYVLAYIVLTLAIYSGLTGATLLSRVKNLIPFDLNCIWIISIGILTTLNMAALYYVACCKSGKTSRRTIVSTIVIGVLTFQAFTVWNSVMDNPDISDRSAMMRYHYGWPDYSYHDFCYRTDYSLYNPNRHCLNVGLITGNPGLNVFHSVCSKSNVPLTTLYLMSDTVSDRTEYLQMRNSLDALMSVKYIVNDQACYNMPQKDLMGYLMPNSHYLPIGFAYDKYVLGDSLIDKFGNDYIHLPLALLHALAVNEADVPELKQYLTQTEIGMVDCSLDSVVHRRSMVTCDMFRGDSHGFSASISLKAPKVIFFSVPYDPGFTAYIDSVPTKIYEANLGMSALVVPAGDHNIRFEYFTPGLKTGALISLAALVMLFIVYVCEGMERRRA